MKKLREKIQENNLIGFANFIILLLNAILLMLFFYALIIILSI